MSYPIAFLITDFRTFRLFRLTLIRNRVIRLMQCAIFVQHRINLFWVALVNPYNAAYIFGKGVVNVLYGQFFNIVDEVDGALPVAMQYLV